MYPARPPRRRTYSRAIDLRVRRRSCEEEARHERLQPTLPLSSSCDDTACDYQAAPRYGRVPTSRRAIVDRRSMQRRSSRAFRPACSSHSPGGRRQARVTAAHAHRAQRTARPVGASVAAYGPAADTPVGVGATAWHPMQSEVCRQVTVVHPLAAS
jgi:hypothetical protein